jgi:chromate transporter
LKPSLRQFLLVWLGLGVQSFGGGAATLALVRRAVVERHGWLTDEDFTRDWALCQVAPGINLLGLTVLIGRRVAGIPGIVLALFGLLFPSCLITVAITATYSRYQHLAFVRAALHGIIPATVGIGLVTAYQIGAPLVAAARREGRGSVAFIVLAMAAAGVVILAIHLSVVMVLCAAGIVGALFYGARNRKVPGETADVPVIVEDEAMQ